MNEQSPWIDHGPSKPCPFASPYSSRVDIRLRDGTEKLRELACNTMWFWYEHDQHDYDVVAYRVPAALPAEAPAVTIPIGWGVTRDGESIIVRREKGTAVELTIDGTLGERVMHGFMDDLLKTVPAPAVQQISTAAKPQVYVPDGYALVPITPTPEMMQAALDKPCFYPNGDLLPWSQITRAAYFAMLDAAPSFKAELPAGGEPFQSRVLPWLIECFGQEIAGDTTERNHRFLEEALELVQACGCTEDEAHKLVAYVYGRDIGERSQEAGGVMLTLAALCLAQRLDMHQCGETELARILQPATVEKIREKQKRKPAMSPLPGVYPERAQQQEKQP